MTSFYTIKISSKKWRLKIIPLILPNIFPISIKIINKANFGGKSYFIKSCQNLLNLDLFFPDTSLKFFPSLGKFINFNVVPTLIVRLYTNVCSQSVWICLAESFLPLQLIRVKQFCPLEFEKIMRWIFLIKAIKILARKAQALKLVGREEDHFCIPLKSQIEILLGWGLKNGHFCLRQNSKQLTKKAATWLVILSIQN